MCSLQSAVIQVVAERRILDLNNSAGSITESLTFKISSRRLYESDKFVCYAMSVSLCVLRFELTENDTRSAEAQQQTFTNWGRYS